MTSDISVVRRAYLTMNFCIVTRLYDRVRGGRFGEFTPAQRRYRGFLRLYASSRSLSMKPM